MVVPTKWQAFRKRYIDQTRHNDYRSAQQEVSAGWAIAKQLRDSGVHNWRVVAEISMQTLIDENLQQRIAEQDRLAAAAQAEEGNEELLSKDDENGNAADAIWRGGWRIGGREPNTANVWVMLDAQRTVCDRRVLKDTQIAPHFMVDLTKWSGPDLRDLQNRQHMDYAIQRRLCTVTDGGQNFVYASGYRNIPDQFTYRTIQEYCDQGDLAAVRDRHPNGIPEPVIWRFLEQLARSAIVMEQGNLAGPVDGWQQIVHYDLKPDNVFLTSSNTGAAYPNAKLGDFEMALQSSEADPFNPHVLRAISANGLS